MAVMTEISWPVADFDPIRRLRVLAAATPGTTIQEQLVAAPLDAVWAVAADLEGELPKWLFVDIASVRTRAAGDDRWVADMRGHTGLRARFDVVLRPGWCLMQSRFLIGGMAAAAEGGGTRFAFLGGMRGPLRPLTALTRPFHGALGRRAQQRFAERVSYRAAD
jgi:hypothetical protein